MQVDNGSVKGQYWVGGLVGKMERSALEHCGWSGNVEGIAYVGGLAGNCSSTSPEPGILGCWSMGTVTASRYAGGAVGLLWDSIVSYSYSQASVFCVSDPLSGEEKLGGLVGMIYGMQSLVKKCYAAGLVQPLSPSTPDVGGLIGFNQNNTPVEDSFWDLQTSGQTASAGGTGKTTAQMKQSITYIDADWDFINLWEVGEHQTYPYIRSRPSADLDRSGWVELGDLAILAEEWLTDNIQPPSE